MTSKYNPLGLPSPQELGYRLGSTILHVAEGKEYYGTVMEVGKNFVVVHSGSMFIKCHPTGRFDLVLGPQMLYYPAST